MSKEIRELGAAMIFQIFFVSIGFLSIVLAIGVATKNIEIQESGPTHIKISIRKNWLEKK